MKKLLLLGAIVTLTACPAPPVRRTAVDRLTALATRPDPSLGSLQWLAGTWATRDTGALTLEVWDLPRAGLLLGHGQSLDGDRTTFFEHLRIQALAQGTALVAYPDGGTPTTFPLHAQGPWRVEFRNPQHDFPQVIGYQREGSLLRIHLDGTNGTQRQTVDLAYRCIAGPCMPTPP